MCVGPLQSLVGVAGGATRAALTVHQARRDNMADISAKDGSQVLILKINNIVHVCGIEVYFMYLLNCFSIFIIPEKSSKLSAIINA